MGSIKFWFRVSPQKKLGHPGGFIAFPDQNSDFCVVHHYQVQDSWISVEKIYVCFVVITEVMEGWNVKKRLCLVFEIHGELLQFWSRWAISKAGAAVWSVSQ